MTDDLPWDGPNVSFIGYPNGAHVTFIASDPPQVIYWPDRETVEEGARLAEERRLWLRTWRGRLYTLRERFRDWLRSKI